MANSDYFLHCLDLIKSLASFRLVFDWPKTRKCSSCDAFNKSENEQCKSCFKLQTLDKIMYKQQLLFDGCMRNEILDNVSNDVVHLTNNDVINL